MDPFPFNTTIPFSTRFVAKLSPPPRDAATEYVDLDKVFSKNKAHKLPPSRGPLDHHIHLEEGSKQVFGPIYTLSKTELEVLKVYIDENM